MGSVVSKASTGPMKPLDSTVTFLTIYGEKGCLIILNGEDAMMREVGEFTLPNKDCVLALKTARDLQNSRHHNSRLNVNLMDGNEAAAIRCGHEVLAYGGESRIRALGTLLFILFMTKRAHWDYICQVANEQQDAKRVAEAFHELCAPLHSMAPTITTKNHR